jgi:hypothetical protein
MKNTVFSLTVCIIAFCVLQGCGSTPVEKTINWYDEPPPSYPLVPITKKIISRVDAQNEQLGKFRFYISTLTILESVSKGNGNLIFTKDGGGKFMETDKKDQIEIMPGRKGILKNHFIDPFDNRDALEICFEENTLSSTDMNRTLIFKESEYEDGRFYLEANSIIYGGQTYTVNVSDTPFLLIRYIEIVSDSTPTIRKLGDRPNGVYIYEKPVDQPNLKPEGSRVGPLYPE